MSDDGTADKKPTPTMQPMQEIADLVMECAKNGMVSLDKIVYSSITLIESKAKSDPTSLYRMAMPIAMRAVGAGNNPIAPVFSALLNTGLGSNRVCTMVVLNMLDEEIKLSGNTVNGGKHDGIQTLYPAELLSDPGKKPEKWANADVIPGAKTTAGIKTYGMGVYRFEKDLSFLGLGVYGTSGVLSFKADSLSDEIAIGWCVPQSGKFRCAATTQQSKHGGAAAFYDKWIEPERDCTRDSSNAKGVALHASMQTWGAVYTGDDDENNNQVLTVAITKA